MKTAYESIINYIASLSENDQVTLWNTYCEERDDLDSMIWDMDDLDYLVETLSPLEAFRLAAMSSDFCYADTWYTFNGYGNLETFSYLPTHIFPEDIAAHCIEEDTDLDDETIYSILHPAAA